MAEEKFVTNFLVLKIFALKRDTIENVILQVGQYCFH